MRLSEHGMDKSRLGSVGLASRVSLGAEIGSDGSRLGEVAREDGLEEGAEDDLGATFECQLLNRVSDLGLLTQSGAEPSTK